MHMSDCVSEAGSSRRAYNYTAKADKQRADVHDKRRWFNDIADLKTKLRLKAEPLLLVEEIQDVLQKVFSFPDLVALFPEGYNQAYEEDERTLKSQASVLQLTSEMQQAATAASKLLNAALEENKKLRRIVRQQKEKIYELDYRMALCRSCTAHRPSAASMASVVAPVEHMRAAENETNQRTTEDILINYSNDEFEANK